MRVLLCPTRFGPDLPPWRVGDAVARGWAVTAPDDLLTRRPLGSSGADLVEAIRAGHSHAGPVDGADPQGVVLVDGVAWIGGPGPQTDTSTPLGRLIEGAVAAGARRVVVGLPEDGPPWDGGAGLLAALGAEALDASGRLVPLELPLTGSTLPWPVADLDLRAAVLRLSATDLLLATDADFPLLGPRGVAQRVDGHEHTLTASDASVGPGIASDAARPRPPDGLEASLRRWAELLGRLPDGRRPSVLIGSGAAGGVGVALLSLGARRVPGSATVVAALDLERLLADVDLVLLAEPVLDHTFEARPGGIVARMALEQAVPVVVLAGVSHLSRREWIRSGVSGCFEAADPATRAVGAAALSALATRVSRTWSPTRAVAPRHEGA